MYKWKETKEEWYELTVTSQLNYENTNIKAPCAYYHVAAKKGDIISKASDPVLGYIKEHEVEIIDDNIT